ncbi:MAG: Gfo/Idh/MocA family oxidoreductase [Tannerella sp.]|jgi:predicted dehydrogenase|nr:Gfo/Idh/MocA family oxidoreductase [Tannerella sp.]
MSDERKISRRGFIGATGLAGAGMMLSNNPLAATVSSMESVASKKFKMAIIGCGNRSKTIISALNDVPEIEIIALCDIVPHKMEQRAQLIKSGDKPKFIKELKEVLQMEQLDAVAVVTPNETHKDIVIESLEAGKHVFCEKPMALTVADCNEMIGAVGRTRKALQIGTQRRHAPSYKKLIEIIRTRPVGQILQSSLFDYRGDWRVPEADEYPAGTPYWRLDQAKSGGVAYEMGNHIIDVNNWVFDSEPIAVCSLQGVNNFSLRKRDSSDHAGVLVEYANGSMMNYGGNVYNYGAKALDTFFGMNGTVQMGEGNITVKYGYPPGFPKSGELPEAETVQIPKGEGVVEELKYFAKVMDGKEQPYPDGYIARQTVQIMEASLISALERRVVDVKELG